jgi:hypothetical protein
MSAREFSRTTTFEFVVKESKTENYFLLLGTSQAEPTKKKYF